MPAPEAVSGPSRDKALEDILRMLGRVMDRMTGDTSIGRIIMPGPTYLGIWARDTGMVALGLNRLGRHTLSGEILARYWSHQITKESDRETFIFRNKCSPTWTEADSFRPSRRQLLAEVGAFPTCVYIETPDFPAGTKEIYGNRADLDSAAWLIIALYDHSVHTQDDTLIRSLAGQVRAAIEYLCRRDEDGDHLLEQDANQDWADTLMRRGKVAYTQAVWFRCLESAGHLFETVGDTRMAGYCRQESVRVRKAINSAFLSPLGYYLNEIRPGTMPEQTDIPIYRRSLDTALLVAFGVADGATARRALEALTTLNGPLGPACFEPGYSPDQTGPSNYPPGQYQNEGVWPWIAAYAALAWAKIGEPGRARDIVMSVVDRSHRTVHEWVDNLTGERHHADFATAAGALAWAISEGGLANYRSR